MNHTPHSRPARRPTKLPAPGASIEKVEVSAFTIPTDFPESDGTLEWKSTTLVVVHIGAADKQGLGYTYADEAVATLIHKKLSDVVKQMDAMSPAAVFDFMWRQIRNLGRPGICSMAISAVDCAIWDLKARLLDLPLVTLLGQVRPRSGRKHVAKMKKIVAKLAGQQGFMEISGNNPQHEEELWEK